MSLIMLEYLCEICDERFESLESRSAMPPFLLHPRCGALAERVISAVKFKTKFSEVTRGKSDPPPPGTVDTRALAEGMSTNEWRKRRSKERRNKRYAEIKANI